ncbi:efflux RND transporter permease subunit [Undibacterium arcticum]
MTLTPLLCATMLKRSDTIRHGRFYNLMESMFNAWRHGYDVSLQRVLRHPRATMAAFAVVVAATGWMFATMPKGFLPSEDTGQIFAITEAAQDISFDAMATKQREAARIALAHPAVASVMSAIGSGGATQTLNQGRLFIRLKPGSQRAPVEDIINTLRPRLTQIPGMRVFLQNVPSIRIGGQLTKSLYQYTLQDADTNELYRWIPAIEGKIRSLPGLRDVTSDLQITYPKIAIDIDRDRAAALGVTAQQIENALYTAYGSRQASTIYTPSNEYWVILEVAPQYQADPSTPSMLYVRSSSGSLVPLSSVTHVSRGVSPLTVNHLGQLPAVTISFDLEPGVALGTAINDINKAQANLGIPNTLTGSFQGSAQAFQASVTGLGLLLVMAVFVIYVVLGILYESTIHPITILSGLPTAGLGALLTLWLFHIDLNIYAFVGIIMLIGIVKKNAIMMIDFAIEASRHRGLPADQAIHEACLTRFRPIMMTTMAALLGTLPIALGIGAGGARPEDRSASPWSED